jgi:hypothetical protein
MVQQRNPRSKTSSVWMYNGLQYTLVYIICGLFVLRTLCVTKSTKNHCILAHSVLWESWFFPIMLLGFLFYFYFRTFSIILKYQKMDKTKLNTHTYIYTHIYICILWFMETSSAIHGKPYIRKIYLFMLPVFIYTFIFFCARLLIKTELHCAVMKTKCRYRRIIWMRICHTHKHTVVYHQDVWKHLSQSNVADGHKIPIGKSTSVLLLLCGGDLSEKGRISDNEKALRRAMI